MTTKDDALIEAMAIAAHEALNGPFDMLSIEGKNAARCEMRAALAVARKAILEEAASVADESARLFGDCNPIECAVSEDIAAAIRALANTETKP